MFSLADGCTMSAKKDGLANIGGFLAMNDDEWAEKRAEPAHPHRRASPPTAASPGTTSRRSPAGLEEVVEEPYLRYRIRSTAYLADKLVAAGVPIIQPAGGHAIYMDARALLPHDSAARVSRVSRLPTPSTSKPASGASRSER